MLIVYTVKPMTHPQSLSTIQRLKHTNICILTFENRAVHYWDFTAFFHKNIIFSKFLFKESLKIFKFIINWNFQDPYYIGFYGDNLLYWIHFMNEMYENTLYTFNYL